MHKEIKTTPKDFFLWIGALVTLYVSAVTLLVLLFEYITILFPDPLDYYVDPYRGAIRFSIASLIVVFPMYVYLMRKINTEARKYAAKQELWVRKWGLYLSLFVAVFTLIVDLVLVIDRFLGGDLSTQFFFKVLAVFIVIGGAFMYYLYDLKGYWQTHETHSKMAGGLVALIVLVSVVSGFFIMGSPADQRLLRFDQEKVDDLSSIQWQLINYWQNKGVLPDELSSLTDSIGGFQVPVDPQTEDGYTYTKTGDMTFTLCATFNKESLETESVARVKYIGEEANWEHGVGEVCFDREIDPDLYPIAERLLN